jgi:hypothetical protein
MATSCSTNTSCQDAIDCLEAKVAALAQRDVEINARMEPCGQEGLQLVVMLGQGSAGAGQDDLYGMIDDWAPDYILAAGDNNYPAGEAATIEANWTAFDTYIDAAKVLPALGNIDQDNTVGSPGQPQTDKFFYLPGNKRYYNLYLPEADTELFVLNSGYNTAGDLVEVDGNTATSVQGLWFTEAVAASNAATKIAMFHEPFVSQINVAAGLTMRSDMEWPDLEKMDLIINGHQNLDEVLTWRGVPVISVNSLQSASTHSTTDGTNSFAIQGTPLESSLLWRDNVVPNGESILDKINLPGETGMAARIFLTGAGACNVEFWQFDSDVTPPELFFNLKVK